MSVIDICTTASLRELATPGLLAVLTPIAVGFGLGVGALGAYLAGTALQDVDTGNEAVKEADGLEKQMMFWMKESLAPRLSVISMVTGSESSVPSFTMSSTVNDPAVSKMCFGSTPVAVESSPKSQR